MDPLVPAKFHAPVIELNVHPSDEGIKAEGASAVATIDASVNTVRGEEMAAEIVMRRRRTAEPEQRTAELC